MKTLTVRMLTLLLLLATLMPLAACGGRVTETPTPTETPTTLRLSSSSQETRARR
jgi:outer membrane lipopolysaccharide assembly protein LptE/RlpB